MSHTPTPPDQPRVRFAKKRRLQQATANGVNPSLPIALVPEAATIASAGPVRAWRTEDISDELFADIMSARTKYGQ